MALCGRESASAQAGGAEEATRAASGQGRGGARTELSRGDVCSPCRTLGVATSTSPSPAPVNTKASCTAAFFGKSHT